MELKFSSSFICLFLNPLVLESNHSPIPWTFGIEGPVFTQNMTKHSKENRKEQDKRPMQTIASLAIQENLLFQALLRDFFCTCLYF